VGDKFVHYYAHDFIFEKCVTWLFWWNGKWVMRSFTIYHFKNMGFCICLIIILS
jgi:hypothetical protein